MSLKILIRQIENWESGGWDSKDVRTVTTNLGEKVGYTMNVSGEEDMLNQRNTVVKCAEEYLNTLNGKSLLHMPTRVPFEYETAHLRAML